MRLFIAAAALAASLAGPAVASAVITPGAGEGSKTDLFNGATVTASSAILSGFSAKDAFGSVTPGGSFAESMAGGHVIFDGSARTAFINFRTAAPVTLSGFVASVASDGVGNAYRGFNGISLLGSTNGASYTVIDSKEYLPTLGPVTLTFSFSPVTYQFFRFFGTDRNGGARLLELDGIGVAAVPEPASWALMIGGMGLVGGVLRTRRSRMLATA